MSARQRGRYYHKDKVLTIVASEVYGPGEAAKHLGISKATVENWRADPELRPYLDAAQEMVLQDVRAVASLSWAEVLVRLMTKPHDISNRDLIAWASEATEKMQLLSGGATERTEHRDLTDVFNDHETQEIVLAARKYLEQYGPEPRSSLAQDPTVALPPKRGTDPAAG